METNLGYRNNLIILGAGASKDYGLPVWKELDSLIRGKLNNGGGNQYSRAKDILTWLDKVGEKNEYKTIDECIEKESVSGVYHSDGDGVENELFLSIKDIFNEVYKENIGGWITKLNNKILRQPESTLEKKVAFINYNYDNVLERNFLRFDHLPGKHARLNNRPRLDELSRVRVPVLYAHGSVYSKSEIPPGSHTERLYKTMKSGVAGYIDAVSCYESDNHTVMHERYADELKLYILGLGGGLKLNLSKLNLSDRVSQISVTISDDKNDEEVLKFLNTKFEVPAEKISVYRTCNELIDTCF